MLLLILPTLRDSISKQGFFGQYALKLFATSGSFSAKCKTNANTRLNQIYTQHEAQKRREYNEQIIHVERSTFTPLVFSSTGGCGNEAQKFIKRLASLESQKSREEYISTLRDLRTDISCSLLRSATTSLRGSRNARLVA